MWNYTSLVHRVWEAEEADYRLLLHDDPCFWAPSASHRSPLSSLHGDLYISIFYDTAKCHTWCYGSDVHTAKFYQGHTASVAMCIQGVAKYVTSCWFKTSSFESSSCGVILGYHLYARRIYFLCKYRGGRFISKFSTKAVRSRLWFGERTPTIGPSLFC